MKKITENIPNRNVDIELKKNYQEALKDKNFEALVKKLNMDEEILMKYTSTLQQSVEDLQICKKAHNIFECKTKVSGHLYLPKKEDGYLVFSYQPCRHQLEIDKQTEHLKNIYFFDVPKEIKQAKMSDIHNEYTDRFEGIKWITNFFKQYPKNKEQKGLYLNGSFGSGKTYFISALFNELAKQGVKSAIVFWPEFLRDIRNSFQTDFNEKINKLKKAPLLLLDDIGAENTTAWNRDEILCPLVQYRMQEKLPTFFTSNLTLKELEEHFSVSKGSVDEVKAKRIIERIKQMTDNVEMVSKNLRN